MTGGAILASFGLIPLVAFAQSTKLGTSGKIGAVFAITQIPAGVALLWRVADDLSWWTAIVFIVASLIAGAINAAMMRRNEAGRLSIVFAQPMMGFAFTLCAIVSCLL